MSDTARTLSALLTIFADGQAKGSITPQDMRDLLVSIQTAYGGMEITTAAETTIETAGVAVKMAGATTIVAPYSYFTMPENNRLTYTGTVAKTFSVSGCVSFTAATNNQIICFGSGINGVAGTARSCTKIGTGADMVAVAGPRIVTLNPNDYLEVFVKNETSDANVTAEHLGYFVSSLFG